VTSGLQQRCNLQGNSCVIAASNTVAAMAGGLERRAHTVWSNGYLQTAAEWLFSPPVFGALLDSFRRLPVCSASENIALKHQDAARSS
jgi:hypothetical protein